MVLTHSHFKIRSACQLLLSSARSAPALPVTRQDERRLVELEEAGVRGGPVGAFGFSVWLGGFGLAFGLLSLVLGWGGGSLGWFRLASLSALSSRNLVRKGGCHPSASPKHDGAGQLFLPVSMLLFHNE